MSRKSNFSKFFNKANQKNVAPYQKKELHGAADPKKFITNGNPMEAIIPIFKQLNGHELKLIGTGFFISVNGLIVSAKHVFRDVIDDKDQKQTAPIGIIQFLPGSSWEFRPLLRCTTHDTADIGVAVAAPMAHNVTKKALMNKILTLSDKEFSIGDTVHTYAYPATRIVQSEKQIVHVQADYFAGMITDVFPNGRDRVLLPGPCYQTSMTIHGGASGGPVFNSRGKVCGINSTGVDGCPDISFVTRIHEALNLKLTGIKFSPDSPTGDTSVRELINRKHIMSSFF